MSAETALLLQPIESGGDWSGIAIAPWLQRVAVEVAGRLQAVGSATIVLADDATVRDLNRRFRNIDKPTNVLSFPGDETENGRPYLGDIVLAAETVRREALAEAKPLDHHFAHLVVHGLLHTLGYDHESDDEAADMERLETEILAAIGVDDPYREGNES